MVYDRVLIVLPARYNSTRLPGKPLVDICGKPMIVRSYENARKQVKHPIPIIVATDDERIKGVCNQHDIPVEMTGEYATGTDRVAEMVKKYQFEYDYYINVQPDEPFLHDGVIMKIINETIAHNEVTCGLSILDDKDVNNSSYGKVVINDNYYAIYMSRAPIPYNGIIYYTQICVYGIPLVKLLDFARHKQTNLEQIEGIEMLRFIEMGEKVKMVYVPGQRLSVDTPEDLKMARKYCEEHKL